MKQNKIYYLVDMNGNNLEASEYIGNWEKDGISNIDVLKHCIGLREEPLYIGESQISFKCRKV